MVNRNGKSSSVPSERYARAEVLVLGAGPAGLAVSAACARRGLEVLCVAPAPRTAWEPTYGCWEDEAVELELEDAVARRFGRPRMWISEAEPPQELDAAYLRFDTRRLQQQLMRRFSASGARLEAGRACLVEHGESSSAVRLADGITCQADVVVDASGAASPFVLRAGRQRPGFQAAYGELIEVDTHPYAEGEMALMDWRLATEERDPTFLYALPMGPHELFVEETSLVRRPPMSFDTLKQRLHRRLAEMGLQPRRVLSRERCLIPMGVALPRRGQRTVAFGAAAGAVHPATGYQLARTIGFAPAVADALADRLSRGPGEAARAAYEVIWPRWRRRAWQLYQVGMEALAAFDLQETRRFFRAFFALPAPRWQGFLHGTLTPSEIAGAMWRVFENAPASLRLRLISTSAGRGSRSLLRVVAP